MSFRVLVACEFSGVVRQAFRARGFDAWSCDLLAAEDASPFHLQCDVLTVLDRGWDLMIAHPPCTYLCNSGNRWLEKGGNLSRMAKMEDACMFFEQLRAARIPRICIENPIQHGYARKYIPRQTQIVQPWMYGHGETKATCLWVGGLPLLTPSKIVAGREQRIFKLPPSAERWKLRSTTFPGIAEAMADQWGGYLHAEEFI